MKKIFLIGSFILALILVNSCTSYYISKDSLIQQFAGIDSTRFKEVIVQTPYYYRYTYEANPIVNIQCTDKNGNPKEIINSPSIETRFTHGVKNKRTVYYFDRIYVDSAAVYGVESRIAPFIRSSIPLDSITKIEIQDGKKKFRYVNK
jgi:hypothetical protein